MIFFDTEYTAWSGSMCSGWNRPGEYREVIQIGAVKVNKKLAIIDYFEVLIKPVFNPTLSDYIKKLTKIEQEKLDAEGVDLLTGLKKFKNFCAEDAPSLVMSNGGDHKIISENLRILGLSFSFDYINFRDIQPLLRKFNQSDGHTSIEEIANKLGVFGEHHSALADSITLYKVIQKIELNINYIKFQNKVLSLPSIDFDKQ